MQNWAKQQRDIQEMWNTKSLFSPESIHQVIEALDEGALRVSAPTQEGWETHEWVKKAILLFFRLQKMQPMAGGAFDKIPLKCTDWTEKMFEAKGFRLVPGAIVRKGAYIAPRVVLMPCFVNIGAYVSEGTMVDTMARVGSSAQIGRNCHLAGGVGIGGVLEPLQATPVIIEDDCFIGAQSQVAEGAVVERGSVLAMNTFIGASTKIIDRETGATYKGRVPAYSVVVPGTYKSTEDLSIACAIIIKKTSPETREKVAVNDLLREN
jgi:2,3,4,5-tetrahydropyridine-2-carboxylate N-succinyltransferase